VSLLSSESSSAPLSVAQIQLVDIIVRLPDSLTNRLARKTPPSLMPTQYFNNIGEAIAKVMEYLVTTGKREL